MRKQYDYLVALAILCTMTMAALFSSCGNDIDDIMLQFTYYSHSDYTKEIYIAGQPLDNQLSMYNLKKLAQKEGEITVLEKIAYVINYNIGLVEMKIESAGNTPANVSGRDKEVIMWYDQALGDFQTETYKDIITGKFEVYRSVNGNKRETIKTYTFSK